MKALVRLCKCAGVREPSPFAPDKEHFHIHGVITIYLPVLSTELINHCTCTCRSGNRQPYQPGQQAIAIVPFELPHDKTNKVAMCPTKTQISLGIRPVWSESSLCAQWVAKDPTFLHADSEDWSDWADAQAELSLCWAHIPHCLFCHEATHLQLLFWQWKAEILCWQQLYTLPVLLTANLNTTCSVDSNSTHYLLCWQQFYTLPVLLTATLHTTCSVDGNSTHYLLCWRQLYTLPALLTATLHTTCSVDSNSTHYLLCWQQLYTLTALLTATLHTTCSFDSNSTHYLLCWQQLYTLPALLTATLHTTCSVDSNSTL